MAMDFFEAQECARKNSIKLVVRISNGLPMVFCSMGTITDRINPTTAALMSITEFSAVKELSLSGLTPEFSRIALRS